MTTKTQRPRIMGKAKDLQITTIEMEAMYNANNRAQIDYKEALSKLSASETMKNIRIHPGKKYDSLERFTVDKMNELATVSHGDIVLIEGLSEMRRVKSNYQQEHRFSNPEPKRK